MRTFCPCGKFYFNRRIRIPGVMAGSVAGCRADDLTHSPILVSRRRDRREAASEHVRRARVLRGLSAHESGIQANKRMTALVFHIHVHSRRPAKGRATADAL